MLKNDVINHSIYASMNQIIERQRWAESFGDIPIDVQMLILGLIPQNQRPLVASVCKKWRLLIINLVKVVILRHSSVQNTAALAIMTFPNLEHLVISPPHSCPNCRHSVFPPPLIASKYIPHSNYLTTSISSDDIDSFADALRGRSQPLKVLDASRITFPANTTTNVLRLFYAFVENVKHLLLTNCTFQSLFVVFAEALRIKSLEGKCKLKSADLSNNSSLRTAGFINLIGSALNKTGCTLKKMSLDQCGIHDSEVDTLFGCKKITSLIDLSLRANVLRSPSTIRLLLGNEYFALRKLDLAANSFGTNALVELADVMKTNTTLEGLSLARWNLESWEPGLRALVEALNTNTSLTLIKIDETNITDNDAIILSCLTDHISFTFTCCKLLSDSGRLALQKSSMKISEVR